MIMKKLIFGILFLFFSLFSIKLSYAQCCAAGNPISIAPEFQQSYKDNLQISLLFRQSYSNTYYNEDEVIDIDYVDHSGFNYLELGIEYGLLSMMSIRLETGYFLSKYEIYKNQDFEEKKAYGIADLNVETRFDLYQKPSKKIKLNGSLGMKFPVGVFDLELDNVKLPVQLQPSSGSYRYHGGLLISKGIMNNKVSIFAESRVEISQRIRSKNFDYKYGTVYVLTLGAGYKLRPNLSAFLQTRAEIRDKSQRENNQIVEASGGTILMLVPQLSYQFMDGWNLNLAFLSPVYRHYNSIQLGNKYSFSLMIKRNNIYLHKDRLLK
ncbi:MAG: hypothetical protein CVT92_10925 [Bacteroidetes bacterium HGW-Bacteroidetes-1]|jgi:hypothetical protein|nr:MAG: hypothetical protein CVT92_10925 [Bacteroidetes bacterium HGW-Bacteroidetes-1]